MNTIDTLKHWRTEIDAQGITWLSFDKDGESTNSLSAEAMAEFAQVLDAFDAQPPKALIVRSAKAAGFIAGADIGEFSQLGSAEEVRNLIARGWNLFNRLADVKYPTLALVKGHCLGGGLELALACRYLLAVDEPGTKMGLPEVMLGIVPGWGGMLRLPERVGPAAAMDMMLTGKTIDARKAKKMGLADDCVPTRVADDAARMMVLSNAPRRGLPLMQNLMAGPLQFLVANGARKQVAKKASPQHYPAPYAIIDIWAKYNGNALLANDAIDRIVQSPTARNLVRVFHLQERLKGLGKTSDILRNPVRPEHVEGLPHANQGLRQAQSERCGVLPPVIGRVHVVGAGVMGGDIAAWCALRGMTVTLQDQSLQRIAPAMERAAKLFGKRVKDKLRAREVMDRLIPDVNGDGVAKADVVIEAIFENVEAKHTLLKSLEARMKPGAILATNTSSLKIEDLRTVLQRPERLTGIHFFNPVAMMPLVEVVQAEGGDEEVTRRACAFVRQIEKLPLPVKSAPGFLVNAVLGPYMLQAMQMVDAGTAPQDIDRALKDFGMPMGPIELADTVGLDIAVAAGKQLAEGAEPPRCLMERVQRGDIGKKSGKGFYVWNNGKAQVPPASGAGGTSADLAPQLIQTITKHTARLVEQGIVADAELADAGVIFGTGFAPWTGGPLHYADT